MGYACCSKGIKLLILNRAEELSICTNHLNKSSAYKGSRFRNINDEAFIGILKSNFFMVDILAELGYSQNSGSMVSIIEKRAEDLEVSLSHLKGNSANKDNTRIDIEKILVKNSTYTNIYTLKRRLINEDLMRYECKICNNKGIWLDKVLVLQLHHINGVNNDHRLCNLCFLCPNCHTQTDNYSGKNQRVSQRM